VVGGAELGGTGGVGGTDVGGSDDGYGSGAAHGDGEGYSGDGEGYSGGGAVGSPYGSLAGGWPGGSGGCDIPYSSIGLDEPPRKGPAIGLTNLCRTGPYCTRSTRPPHARHPGCPTPARPAPGRDVRP
jgi:hypothetical protein